MGIRVHVAFFPTVQPDLRCAAGLHGVTVQLPNSMALEAHGIRLCVWSACCEVMAVRHASRPTQCVPFHPESEFTQYRGAIFANMVSLALDVSSSVSTSHACIDWPCTPSVTAKRAVLVHGSPQYSLRDMEQPLHAFAPFDGLLRTARMLRYMGPCMDGANIRAPSIDAVGTGGGRARRLNESTLASVAIASMGALAAKHGGSGITRRHGSANAMELLGYATTGYTYALRLIEAGCGFLLSSARLPQASRHARLRRKARRPGLVSWLHR